MSKLETHKQKSDPLGRLLWALWWITMMVAYGGFTAKFPDTPGLNAFADLFHQYSFLIYGYVFVFPAVILPLLAQRDREQEDDHEPSGESKAEPTSPVAVSPTPTPVDSACPMCGNELKHRSLHNKEATKDGFWECSTYPKCWYRRTA